VRDRRAGTQLRRRSSVIVPLRASIHAMPAALGGSDPSTRARTQLSDEPGNRARTISGKRRTIARFAALSTSSQHDASLSPRGRSPLRPRRSSDWSSAMPLQGRTAGSRSRLGSAHAERHPESQRLRRPPMPTAESAIRILRRGRLDETSGGATLARRDGQRQQVRGPRGGPSKTRLRTADLLPSRGAPKGPMAPTRQGLARARRCGFALHRRGRPALLASGRTGGETYAVPHLERLRFELIPDRRPVRRLYVVGS
jgi:hypothetical protein